MRCLLGIALSAAPIASAAHAEDGRPHLEAGYKRVFIDGETDNAVDGHATLPETEESVTVLRTGHDLPPAFMVKAMLGLGSCDAIVGTSAGPSRPEIGIERSIRVFGTLWTSPYRGAGVRSRVGVASVANGCSVVSLTASRTRGGMDCVVVGHATLSDALSLHFDAAQHRSNGVSACSADGVGPPSEA